MPVYEYRCNSCHATFDVLVRHEGGIVCPHCGGQGLDKLISAPVVLSGRTIRPAGRTCCDRAERGLRRGDDRYGCGRRAPVGTRKRPAREPCRRSIGCRHHGARCSVGHAGPKPVDVLPGNRPHDAGRLGPRDRRVQPTTRLRRPEDGGAVCRCRRDSNVPPSASGPVDRGRRGRHGRLQGSVRRVVRLVRSRLRSHDPHRRPGRRRHPRSAAPADTPA